MLAYHNDAKIKSAIISQLQAHYDADEIIKGVYWERGKGCAVGCTIHGSDHSKYEELFGIPIVLPKLKDYIFECLPNHLAKEWPLQFMSAIKEGSDLSKVWNKFAIWLLSDENFGVMQHVKSEEAKKAISTVNELYIKSIYEEVDISKWDDAADAVAAYAAYAVRAAVAAVAADAAACAAACAADAADAVDAAYAVRAVRAAACAAAYAAADAAADAAAADTNHYIAQSQKLLELLRECN